MVNLAAILKNGRRYIMLFLKIPPTGSRIFKPCIYYSNQVTFS